MKAVLLAGGLGTRMREETEFRPKPMVEVGGKPILWHIMKIYAAAGVTDFVICAGYKGDVIKNYFYNYGPANMDFTVKLGHHDDIVYHGNHDEFNWTVTVADTGPKTMTGGRIKRIQKYVGDEPFFCTYGDGVADVDIEKLLEHHKLQGKLATMTTTKPTSRFGVVDIEKNGTIGSFREKPKVDDWINIGYFVFEPEIFDQIDGDSTVLEEEPLHRLASRREISAFPHEGFWQPMDTYREAQMLNDLWDKCEAPWKKWD